MSHRTALAQRLRMGSAAFVVISVLAVIGAVMTESDATRAIMISSATVMGVILLLLNGIFAVATFKDKYRFRVVMDFLEHDSAPGFCTNDDGAIFAQNRAAEDKFGALKDKSMTKALEPLFINPDSVVHRLRSAAYETGIAREDVVTRRGHVRIAVHTIRGGLLWRLEDLVERPQRAADGIGLPIMTAGSSGTILYMNEVMRGLLGSRAKRLVDVFEEVPLQNGYLNRLKTPSGWESVRLILSEPVNGRQEIFVLPAGEGGDGRVALDALPVAMVRLDAQGAVVFANRSARELLPMAGDGRERRLAAMVEGLGRSVNEWVAEAAAGRGLYRPEIVRVSGAATDTFLQITLGRPMDEGDGGLIAVLNDATELKTMEAQFVQSQKMQAIGQLAGGVAHDFNNLLTAISGHCDLLLLRHQDGDEDYADLTQITQNANRAAALVGQLLAFSRKQTLEMKQIDLRDTLGDLTHLLNRLVGERVRLRLDHDPGLIPIRGDRRQLEQVLMNLVVNARDAMPDGGEILIETKCRFLDEQMTRDRVTVPTGQYVVVTVSDDGCGIPADKLQRIFEPFFTTKRPGEGTGLGLSMAYGIMKQSGGYIFADSTPGQGAKFSLYFPADPVAHRSGEASLVSQSQAVEKPRRALETMVLTDPPKKADYDPDTASAQAALSKGPEGPEAGSVSDGEALAESLAARLMAEAAEHAGAGTAAAVDDDRRGEDEAQADTMSGSEAADPASTGVNAVRDDEPATLSDGGAATDKPADDGDTAKKQRVLLVEDEAPVRAFASRALRLRGYEVVEAACAEDALVALEDEGLHVDLFVTDVMMPGMDGPSWVREALKNRPTVRTVFMSGYAQDALSETSTPVPNAVFLAKPFSLSDLTRTVERVLH